MKLYSFFIILATAMCTVPAAAQYSQNFESTNPLTSGCALVVNADRTTISTEVISGIGSLFTNPPVNGSGTRDYATPYLNIVDPLNAAATTTTLDVSFNYKLNETLSGQAVRFIEVGLQGTSSYTPLTTINMDKNNDPVVPAVFGQSFTVPVGVQRLVLKMGGSQGNGSVRIIVDDLLVSASPYYTLGGTCNTAPSILNDVYFTPMVASYTGTTVLANDSEPNGETLSAPVLVTPSPDGTVVLNPDGTFTFTPIFGFTGSFTSFTYRVYDNGYDPMAGTATVTIYFTSAIILPVKLVSFEGTLVQQRTQLRWTVEENETGEGFVIEKSTDGRSFHTIDKVASSGKSGTESYVYNEGQALSGGAYYRIRILQQDNNHTYTRVVYLNAGANSGAGSIKLLENPVRSQLAFGYNSGSRQMAVVNLYNAAGARVQWFSLQLEKGLNTVTKPVNSRLAPGTYILELATATERITVKLIK